jgi:hypothetical protein
LRWSRGWSPVRAPSGTRSPSCSSSRWSCATLLVLRPWRIWLWDIHGYFLANLKTYEAWAWVTQHPLVHHPKNLVLGFHGWDETVPQGSVYLVISFFYSEFFFHSCFFFSLLSLFFLLSLTFLFLFFSL